MDLRVDDAGEQMQAAPVDEEFVIHWFKGGAQSHSLNDAVANPQIPNTRFVGQDHRCAVNQYISRHAHPLSFPAA